ncbi:hypothetical protein TH63_11580 [Rufibacter radiotolerans]|uniref:Uncharacterized protein n=1 Tax=Rufibacter radiotolerans TaxID=1379910 RepID=A0A0H4VLB7_9BACT|nr:hypothetical protein TH63_11580 [Rufibacter radiotolerans]
MLGLMLGILLLGKPTQADKAINRQSAALEPQRNWEKIEFPFAFSRTSIFTILGLNQLPPFQEEGSHQDTYLRHSVSYSSQVASSKSL